MVRELMFGTHDEFTYWECCASAFRSLTFQNGCRTISLTAQSSAAKLRRQRREASVLMHRNSIASNQETELRSTQGTSF